jgi:hypothetical protein
MNSLADTLWTLVRWTVPVTVACVVAAGAIGSSRISEQVRSRVEARLAEEFPALTVQVQGASLVEGEGIVIRGVSVTDPKMPQQWRQILWIDEIRLACTTSLTELAAGPPNIRSVRVRRPMVHAVRHADGSWNVAKIVRQREAKGIVPVTIEDATLLVDDTGRRLRATLRQIAVDLQPSAKDANGEAWATLRGSIAGDLFDRVGFQGRLAPSTGAFELAGDLESLDITPRLAAFLPALHERCGSTEVQELLSSLRGRCDLRWQASGGLNALDEAVFAVSGRLESGRFEHAAIPFAMTDLAVGFRADRSGVLFENLEAHSGSTMLRGSGRLAGWNRDADFDLIVEAERLTVSRQWESHLPEQFASHWRKLLPAGEVDLRAHITRRSGKIDPKVSLRCRNASITHYRFPYRLDRTVGTVVLDGGALSIHLTGQAGGHPVHVQGAFQMGTGPDGSGSGRTSGFLEVRGDGMRMDDALLAAMPARSAAVVRALHASGTFDFVFRHDRSPEFPNGYANSLGIHLERCSMCYAGFPYPLSNVSGNIRMDGGRWTIKEIVGSNDTGTVRCTGALVPRGDDDGELTLELAGTGVVLDRELRDALPRGVGRIWDDIDPRGNVEFRATVRHQVKARQTDVELEATPQADTVSIEPSWFPYRLEQLRGKIGWKNGIMRFEGVRGVHARTTVATEGTCRFTPEGGWHVSFERLSADRFRADHDVLQAMPSGLQRAIAAVHPRGLLSLSGSLDIYSQATPEGAVGPAAAAWDMQLDMEQGTLDIGVALEHVHGGVHLKGQTDGRSWQSFGEVAIDSAIWRGVQVTAVQGPLVMDDGGVRFGMSAAQQDQGRPRRISARVAGGSVFVDGSVAAGAPGTFAVSASLGDADLERLALDSLGGLTESATPQRYRGRVFCAIEVSGSRAGMHSLVGRGQLRLREADIYELPVIVALFKVLRVKAPDRKAFSSSLVDFRIEGPHAYLDNIELSGDAISLVGNGEVDFDSQVRMTFRSIMGDSETQLPVMKRVLGGASGQFMLIHVDGTLTNPAITTEAFPTLSAALQQLQSQRREPGGIRSAAAARREARETQR